MKRSVGRPRLTEMEKLKRARFSIGIPLEMKQQLDDLAEQQGLGLSTVIRHLLKLALANQGTMEIGLRLKQIEKDIEDVKQSI